VGVRDDPGHAREPARHEPQKCRLGGAVLGGDDVEAQDFSVAVSIEGRGYDGADVGGATIAVLDRQRIDPHIGVGGAVIQGSSASIVR
jgi:hypothetical protein